MWLHLRRDCHIERHGIIPDDVLERAVCIELQRVDVLRLMAFEPVRGLAPARAQVQVGGATIAVWNRRNEVLLRSRHRYHRASPIEAALAGRGHSANVNVDCNCRAAWR